MAQESSDEPHPLDEHRDQDGAAMIRAFAAQVAADFGGDFALMQRANGYSNSTWVGGGLAVRVADGPVDMAREAALLRALPPGVGHPRVLGVGVSKRHGWLVTTQVTGQNLQEAWSKLSPQERPEAIHQLWARVQAVHDATPSLTPFVTSSGGYIPATRDAAIDNARRVGDAVGLSHRQQTQTDRAVDDYYRLAAQVVHVVNHGDFALMNALWHRDHVVALLDFEFAVLGPVEIDLCRLVAEARLSDDGHVIDHEAGHSALKIAAHRIDGRHGRQLLLGTAVLDQLRDLTITLDHEATSRAVHDSRPHRLLVSLLDSERGYLAPLLG